MGAIVARHSGIWHAPARGGARSAVTEIVLPIALAIIMATLGLTLTPDDFRRIFRAPRGVVIGLGNLLLLSPLWGFLVAELTGLDPVMAVGLVLLAASPGGAMANLLTHLARGETALSVTMTAVSSVCAVLTVPLFLTLAIDHFDAPLGDDVSMLGTVVRVFSITLIPLAIGMTYRARRPEKALALEPRIKPISLAVFALVVLGAVISEFDKVTDSFAEVAPAALLLNLVAMSASFAIALAARLPERSATAIAMELGVHNSTLTITVATSIDSELAIPGAVYSVFMFLTAGLFARVMGRRNAAAGAEAAAAAPA
ncbi:MULTISPECIES: bile acid:sodium symporter family protein [Solirubrobacterales]|nr:MULTISPECIES: bile acid:sodium symporter family protein [Solirubrobacterales]